MMQGTMCVFHDFGLIWKCQKMCFGCLHDYLKDICLKFFLTQLRWPIRSKKFQKMLISAFEANSENETKIVKITHSARL